MKIDVNAPWNKSQPYATSKPVYRKMVTQPSGKLAVGIGFNPVRFENMQSRVITYMPTLGILKDVTFHGMPKDSISLAHYEIHLHPDVEDVDAQRIGDDYINHIAQGLRPEDFKHPELGSLDFDRHADINLSSENYKGAVAKDGHYPSKKFTAQQLLGKAEINPSAPWVNVGAGGHLWTKRIMDSRNDKLPLKIGFSPRLNRSIRVIPESMKGPVIRDISHGPESILDDVGGFYDIHVQSGLALSEYCKVADKYIQHLVGGGKPEDFKDITLDYHPKHHISSENSPVFRGSITQNGFMPSTTLDEDALAKSIETSWRKIAGRMYTKVFSDSVGKKLGLGIGFQPGGINQTRMLRILPGNSGSILRDSTYDGGYGGPDSVLSRYYEIHLVNGLDDASYQKIADKYIEHINSGKAPGDFYDRSLSYHPNHHNASAYNPVYGGAITSQGHYLPHSIKKSEEDWNEDNYLYFDHPNYTPELDVMGASHFMSVYPHSDEHGNETWKVQHVYPESMYLEPPHKYSPIIGEGKTQEEARAIAERYVKSLQPKVALGIGFPRNQKAESFPDDKEIEMGLEEEMEEHNIPKELAMKLVVDHLLNDPKYYTHQKEAKAAGLVKSSIWTDKIQLPVGTGLGIGFNRSQIKTVEADYEKLGEAYKAALWDLHKRNPLTLNGFGSVMGIRGHEGEVERSMLHYLQHPDQGLAVQPKHSVHGYNRSWDFTHFLPEEYRNKGYTLQVGSNYDGMRDTSWNSNLFFNNGFAGGYAGKELYGAIEHSYFKHHDVPPDLQPHLQRALDEAFLHNKIAAHARDWAGEKIESHQKSLNKAESDLWQLKNIAGYNVLEAEKVIDGTLHRFSVMKYDVPKTDPMFGKWFYHHQQGTPDYIFDGKNSYSEDGDSVEHAQRLAEDRMREFNILPPRPKLPLSIGFPRGMANPKPALMEETPESKAFEDAFNKEELSMPQPKTTPKKFNDQHPIGTQIDPPDAVSSQTVGRVKTQGVDPSTKAPLPPKNSMVTSGKVMGPTGRAVSSREPNQKAIREDEGEFLEPDGWIKKVQPFTGKPVFRKEFDIPGYVIDPTSSPRPGERHEVSIEMPFEEDGYSISHSTPEFTDPNYPTDRSYWNLKGLNGSNWLHGRPEDAKALADKYIAHLQANGIEGRKTFSPSKLTLGIGFNRNRLTLSENLEKGWPKSPEENDANIENERELHEQLANKGATITVGGKGDSWNDYDSNTTQNAMTQADYLSDLESTGPKVKYGYGSGTGEVRPLPSRGEWWTNTQGIQHRDFVGPNDEQHHISIRPLSDGKAYIHHENRAARQQPTAGMLTDKPEQARDIVDSYIVHVNNPVGAFDHPAIVKFPPEAYAEDPEYLNYYKPSKYIEPPVKLGLGIGLNRNKVQNGR